MADIVQIGARNMQNYPLKGGPAAFCPTERSLSATVEEWLMAAEYIMAAGNYRNLKKEESVL